MKDDTISRVAAINAICEDGTQLERQGRYSMTMVERKQRDADILDALPSAKPVAKDTNVPVKDCISRQAAIDALAEWHDVAITNRLNNLPSAQQEIVACGDCIHWICHDRRCGYWNHGVKPLDWCCHAERRTNG